jgi:hypothetical protein
MSVPPDKLMELMKGSQAAAGAPTPNEMPEEMDTELPEAPPMASPMSTPEPKMGNKEAALINISMAIDLLEQSLPRFWLCFRRGQENPQRYSGTQRFDWSEKRQDRRITAI